MIFGSGKYRYTAVAGWGGGPDGWDFGIVSSMAADSLDRVHVIDREPNPAIVVLDRDGVLQSTWGQDFFKQPHSIWIDSDDLIYIADCGLHTVTVHSPTGELISTLGTPNQPGDLGKPFNKPTWVVRADDGDFYVSDGYGQNYVHRFSADSELLNTWGGSGTEPGRFDLPHCVRVDSRDRVLVVDRTNERVQTNSRPDIDEIDLFLVEHGAIIGVRARGARAFAGSLQPGLIRSRDRHDVDFGHVGVYQVEPVPVISGSRVSDDGCFVLRAHVCHALVASVGRSPVPRRAVLYTSVPSQKYVDIVV